MQTCMSLYIYFYFKIRDTYPLNRLGFDATVQQVLIVHGVGQLGTGTDWSGAGGLRDIQASSPNGARTWCPNTWGLGMDLGRRNQAFFRIRLQLWQRCNAFGVGPLFLFFLFLFFLFFLFLFLLFTAPFMHMETAWPVNMYVCSCKWLCTAYVSFWC